MLLGTGACKGESALHGESQRLSAYYHHPTDQPISKKSRPLLSIKRLRNTPPQRNPIPIASNSLKETLPTLRRMDPINLPAFLPCKAFIQQCQDFRHIELHVLKVKRFLVILLHF